MHLHHAQISAIMCLADMAPAICKAEAGHRPGYCHKRIAADVQPDAVARHAIVPCTSFSWYVSFRHGTGKLPG